MVLKYHCRIIARLVLAAVCGPRSAPSSAWTPGGAGRRRRRRRRRRGHRSTGASTATRHARAWVRRCLKIRFILEKRKKSVTSSQFGKSVSFWQIRKFPPRRPAPSRRPCPAAPVATLCARCRWLKLAQLFSPNLLTTNLLYDMVDAGLGNETHRTRRRDDEKGNAPRHD